MVMSAEFMEKMNAMDLGAVMLEPVGKNKQTEEQQAMDAVENGTENIIDEQESENKCLEGA